MNDLLELRRKLKAKKPNFIRRDAHKKKRLGVKWRKPKGIHNKIKDKLKGYLRPVTKGWKSPRKVRYLSRTGLMPVLVRSINDIKNIDKEKQGIIVSKTVGNKKRIELVKKAQELKLTILNMKDPAACIKKIQDDFEKRKQEKKEIEKKRKEEKKKETKKEGLAEKISGEEKKKQEKLEKDKVLTKKE